MIDTEEQHFRPLVDDVELAAAERGRPRLHDLLHTFATGHIIAAYAHGANRAHTLSLWQPGSDTPPRSTPTGT